MIPPAWSSSPEMGLNFTSTKPSLRFDSSLIASGYVASPDCFRTFGLLGALLSCSTVHFGSPLPVLVRFQPAGADPDFKSSKLMLAATSGVAIHIKRQVESFMSDPFLA